MTIKRLLATLALTTASTIAAAAPWTQTIDFTPDVYIGPAYSWTHDLTTVGFRPGSDLINNFQLTVQIGDDVDTGPLFTRFETGFLDVHDSLLSDRILLTPIGSNSTNGNFNLGAIFRLNANGTLGVTLSATTGDFILQSASLTATGTSVPEPGSLALAGLALTGVVVLRRRERRA